MVSQDRLTRTYDECSKRPVFGDCAKSNGFSLERPKNRLQHLRPDGPHDAQGHQKADPSRQCGWKQAPGRSHRGSSRTVTAATVGLTEMAFSWKALKDYPELVCAIELAPCSRVGFYCTTNRQPA